MIQNSNLPVSTLFCRKENYNSFVPQIGLSLKGWHWCLPSLLFQICYWNPTCKNSEHCYILMRFSLSDNETSSIISKMKLAWTRRFLCSRVTLQKIKAQNRIYQTYESAYFAPLTCLSVWWNGTNVKINFQYGIWDKKNVHIHMVIFDFLCTAKLSLLHFYCSTYKCFLSLHHLVQCLVLKVFYPWTWSWNFILNGKQVIAPSLKR